jgi:hypothetical protein
MSVKLPPPKFTFSDGSYLLVMSARWFVDQTVWEANRTLDPEHATDLEHTIKDPTTIQGPFTMVAYPNDEGIQQLRIIDGQHRQEVLRRYFAANPTTADFQILVRRYQIANYDEASTIFAQINHAKPIQYRGSDTERLHAIVTALKRAFLCERSNGKFVAMIRPGCNRPALSTEYLETAIKLYGIHQRTDIFPEDIVAHATAYNGWVASEPLTRIQNRVTQSILDRAIEDGFFLGLDPKCPWLMDLRLKA